MVAFMDSVGFNVVLPLMIMGGFALTVLGAVEIGGRIRAKIKGEKWESPIVW